MFYWGKRDMYKKQNGNSGQTTVIKRYNIFRRSKGFKPGWPFLFALFVLATHHQHLAAVEVVTWDGTRGVGSRIFTGSGVQKCRYCHESGNQASFWPDSSPTLNSYASVTSGSNATDSNNRIQAETMPRTDEAPTGSDAHDYDPLSGALQSLMATWISSTGGVTPENATPHAETRGTFVNLDPRYTRTLNGRANMNGNSVTSLFLEYRPTGSLTWQQAGSAQFAATSGGGGAETSSRTDFSRNISGLACGTNYQYRVRVSSPFAQSISTFTTAACNASPSITTSNAVTAVNEDNTYTYNFAYSDDSLGGTISPSLIGQPAGMSIINVSGNTTSGTGTITWTPDNDAAGSTYNFSLSIADNGEDGATAAIENISLTVNPVNDPPSISGVPATINGAEETPITPIAIGVSDVDNTNNGVDMSWSLSSLAPMPANMIISSTGLIAWTPQEGFTGPQDITVEVCDSGGLCDSDTFTATATAENDAPVLDAIADVTIDEDSPWSLQVTFNDPDAGDSHTFALANNPTGMSISATGLISWTPDDEHLPGASNVEVIIQDSALSSDNTFFSVAVNPVNDQPYVFSIPDTDVLEGDLALIQVLVDDPDDTDWPSDINFSLDNEPAGMSIDEEGLISWQTAEGDASASNIRVIVSDGGEDGTSPFERVFDVNVIAYNYQPVIESTAPTDATEDIEYSYQLVIDDVDDPNDGSGALSFALLNAPEGMTISATGLITWTPTEGVLTSDTVTAQVTDGGEDATVAATEAFSITVEPVNDAPVITSAAPVSVIEMNTWSYTLTVADPDNNFEALSFDLEMAPEGMTIGDDGFATWYAPEAAGSSGLVRIRVTDPEGASDIQEFTIDVIVFNTPPVISSPAPTSATEDELWTYQPIVDDVDDANDGEQLSWTLQNAPQGMTINSTGLISWTPTEGVTSSGLVSLIVADGGEDAAPAYQQDFTVTVVAVNDGPVITSTPANSVIQGTQFNYQVSASDPDDDPGSLNYSLSGQPSGMVVSSSGLVTWTPDASSPASSTITLSVRDGGENGAPAATQTFTLSVVFDIDQDGISNSEDNCETVANSDQANNDGDEFGDVCDFDDDNDGMSDVYETANGFNPNDPADASADSDGDGLSNLEEFLQGSDPFGDDNPPRITLPLNNLWISGGYFTWVDIGEAVATDALGGPVEVTPNRQSGGFRPGRHEIVWTATDGNNNSAQATQVIRVLPLIALAPNQITGEGRNIQINLQLNGEPPEEPATVNYRISGPAGSEDHDASNGQLTFENRRASLEITIFEDDITEGEERFLLTLSNPINAALGSNFSQEVRIVESNVAPRLRLRVLQDGQTGSVVNRLEGNVTVEALIDDPNANESFIYDWSLSANALVALNGSGDSDSATFEFSPVDIATRLYPVHLTITDSGGANASATVLVSVQSSTQLTDEDDNGIIDSADAIEESFALQSSQNGKVLESDAHLRLSLGQTARHVGLNGAALNVSDVENFGNNGFQAANAFTEMRFASGLFDLVVEGLDDGASANLILAQLEPLEDGVFVHYQVSGGWSAFVEDERNFVASAATENGVCPSINDLAYEPGIIAGYDCIQVHIEDGGPNDSDGVINGKVSLLAGVGSGANTSPSGGSEGSGNETPTNSNSGGGSFSPSLLTVFLFLFLLAHRQSFTRNRPR